jgi:hypothetical protein
MNTKKIIFAALTSLGLIFTSCNKENPTPAQSSGAKGNTFQVRMTDAPGDYQALFVQIDQLEAYLDGSGWVNLSSKSQVINVLELTNGKEVSLTTANQVKAGHYSKLRLTFGSENKVVLNSSSSAGLTLGEGMTANSTLDLNVEATLGVKRQVEIVIDQQISSSVGASVLIDFDVAASVLEKTDGWWLNPVIRVIKDENTGVKGAISGSQQASISISKPGFSASTHLSASGDFLIKGLEEGTYTLVIDAEVEGQTNNEIKTIPGVTVVRGRIENLGTIQL